MIHTPGPTIIVTGSRDWTDEETMRRWLSSFPIRARLAHGGARGADLMAARLAAEVGLIAPIVAYPFSHDDDGPWPAAGPRRNRRMIDAELMLLGVCSDGPVPWQTAFGVAFTSCADGSLTRGTASAVEHMLRRGLSVIRVRPGQLVLPRRRQ